MKAEKFQPGRRGQRKSRCEWEWPKSPRTKKRRERKYFAKDWESSKKRLLRGKGKHMRRPRGSRKLQQSGGGVRLKHETRSQRGGAGKKNVGEKPVIPARAVERDGKGRGLCWQAEPGAKGARCGQTVARALRVKKERGGVGGVS